MPGVLAGTTKLETPLAPGRGPFSSATREGDGYRLNGQKVFISGAGDTDVLVVMARVADENGLRRFRACRAP